MSSGAVLKQDSLLPNISMHSKDNLDKIVFDAYNNIHSMSSITSCSRLGWHGWGRGWPWSIE